MGKRIEIDGRFYRMRRGKLVEIPQKWVGQTSHLQTQRKRQSKFTRKIKRWMQGLKKGRLGNYQELKWGMLDGDK